MDAVEPSGGGTLLHLEVTAGAKHPEFPAGYNPWRKRIGIKVRAPAQDGKANQEIEATISNIWPATIISGQKDTRKTVYLHAKPGGVRAYLMEKLRQN